MLISSDIFTQKYSYVAIYVSGSKDLILIRFFVSFSDSNVVFHVVDDDHQWSVCCHQIPEGLEHTPCAFIILNYLSVKSIYYMPLWIHSMKITLHFLHNIQWNKCVEVTWLFSFIYDPSSTCDLWGRKNLKKKINPKHLKEI